MKFAAINAQLSEYTASWMCKKLKVSRAGFYSWKNRTNCAREIEDQKLAVKIRAYHQASRKTYGSVRILRDLRDEGIRVGRKRVMRLMRTDGLSGRRKTKYVHTTNSNHRFPIAQNVLERNFEVDEPNKVWVGDITYLRTDEGWVYLAVLLDLYSRKIVGWAVSNSMHTALPLDALKMALFRRRPLPGLIHHTDRGVQYASTEYRQELVGAGLVCSMSRRGDCWDNAAGESVFARIKDDLVYRTKWESKAQAMAETQEYIESFYNETRRHSANDFVSPNRYEAARQRASSAA